MKVKLTPVAYVLPSTPPLPAIMVHTKHPDLIVLFVTDDTGIVLSAGPASYRVGTLEYGLVHYTHLAWTPYIGAIVLEN